MLGVGRILELHRPARRFRPSRIRPVPPGRHWCPRAPRRCRRARPRHRRIGCRCHGWRRNCRRQPPCHCRCRCHCPRRRCCPHHSHCRRFRSRRDCRFRHRRRRPGRSGDQVRPVPRGRCRQARGQAGAGTRRREEVAPPASADGGEVEMQRPGALLWTMAILAADTNHEPVPVTSPQPAAAARSSCGRRHGRRARRPGLPRHRGSRCA